MNNQAMCDLVETICRALVEYPEELHVSLGENDDSTYVVKIQAKDSDMGKIIGKSGRIARAIRTVVKSYAMRSNEKVFVEIVE